MDTETKKYVDGEIFKLSQDMIAGLNNLGNKADKSIDKSVRFYLLKHFDKKFSALQIILAALAIHLAIVFFFSDQSAIEARLFEQSKSLNSLALDLNTLKNNNRPPGWGSSEGHRRTAGPEPVKEGKK